MFWFYLATHRINFFYLYFFYFLYVFFELISCLNLREKIWDLLKIQIFYVSGQCQHSGHCCRALRIYDKGKALSKISEFNKKKEEDFRFKRFYIHGIDQFSLRFSCSSLSKYNRCLQYETRPEICKNYPYSMFLNSEYISPNCAYFLKRKALFFKPRFHSLRQRILRVMICNGLV